jgi:CheY-like chemotaxis protein
MENVLIIDDDAAFLELMRSSLTERHPGLSVQTCSDPINCLAKINRGLDLLLVDLEMPGLDGSKVLAYATSAGVSKSRVIILSARDAEYLHQRFPLGSCLAVLNKHEAKQKEVLDMVLNALERKARQSEPYDPDRTGPGQDA